MTLYNSWNYIIYVYSMWNIKYDLEYVSWNYIIYVYSMLLLKYDLEYYVKNRL